MTACAYCAFPVDATVTLVQFDGASLPNGSMAITR